MILAAALILDALLGEPAWLWRRVPHPVVAMGRLIEALDARLNRGARRRLKGVAALAVAVGAAGAAGWLLSLPGPAAEAAGAAILLAQCSLADHVRAVADALRDGGVMAGRRAVAMIVGRDTTPMDAAAVSRAAIESAAENLSDGVVAPAFWFAVAGLPGIAVYKAINTADSTIGYLTDRHREFGWAAAKLDDVVNWLPARLTAWLILLVHRRGPRGVAADARLHRSPNAGWPEAALARVLGVALAGPRSYDGRTTDFPWVHPEGRRDAGAADVDRAVAALWRVWAALLGAAVVGGSVGMAI